MLEVYVLRRSLFTNIYNGSPSYGFSLRVIIFSSPVFHGCTFTIVLGSCIALMQADVMKEACPYFRIDGKLLPEAIDDLNAFSKMSDSILDLIENYPSAELQRSREILNRIDKRDFYVEVGYATGRLDHVTQSERFKVEEKVTKEIVQISYQLGEGQPEDSSYHTGEQLHQLTEDDVIVRRIEK